MSIAVVGDPNTGQAGSGYVSDAYVNSLLRKYADGTLTPQQEQNFLTNWKNGNFSVQQQAQLRDLRESLRPGPPPTPEGDWSIQGYLDSIEWDGSQDKFGRDAATIWQDIGEYGIDGGNFGYDESSVEAYFSDLLGHNDPKPAWDGSGTRVGTSGGAGGLIGDPMTPQGGPPEGVNPDYVPDMEGQPEYTQPPPTTQPPAGGGDPFQPTAPPPSGSGYIDSFLPGSRNDQFYTDQFNRLAAQNYDFQNQQALANQMRQEAAQQPAQGMPKDPFAWMDYKLPEVEVNDRGYANPFPGYEGNVGSQNSGQYFNPYTGMTQNTPVYGFGGLAGGSGGVVDQLK